MVTVISLIALASMRGWNMYQMDMYNAFLQGDLYEKVYMEIPQGFRRQGESKVCKSMKTLYGLKQASRQWNIKLTEPLTKDGYKKSLYDYSLLTKQHGEKFVEVLIYVDDLLITENNEEFIRETKDNLGMYVEVYPSKFILGYCSTYIFMQTFMIPGTIFMSLLAGALFGIFRGLLLVVFNATAGASSCYFLSKLIGRPIVNWMCPEKLRFFPAEIAKRRDKLLNYMLFLRITPALPYLFINLASPIVDIPFHIFFFATVICLIPAAYITVKAGLTLGELKSVKDFYDFKTLSVLFLIGALIILPTILKRKRIYE
ncbi:hypothetical protein CQW23_09866 [Capsicum baccatum]|uniref:Uncharacterized protein n=1 Tax=Capsicum baccatum TaxID=33114 RepID=A0A2G2WY70_CAPBA|nr:hypothetical protein CQW23_09866 [Capsicum baccatum]